MDQRENETAERLATHRLDRVRPLCLEAIETMRRFLDDAERSVKYEDTPPEMMIERTVHRLAWGFANASSHLSSALGKLQDVREIRESQTP